MQTPHNVTLEGFFEARRVFLDEECRTEPMTGRVCCRKCGDKIHAAPALMDIHDATKGQCVGGGEQFEAAIPYCARCEPMPEKRGCVHA